MNNYKIRKRNNNATLKEVLIIMGTFLFVAIIIYYSYIKTYNIEYDRLKKEVNKYLVYTKYEDKNNNYSKYVPYININSPTADQVNNDIDEYLLEYINIKKTNITYEFSISGDLLSLVLRVSDYQDEYEPKIFFKTYIINLETLNLVSDQELLELYQIDETTVNNAIAAYFNQYYEELVEKGFYDPNVCDYSCYLKYREVDNYLDNINYYVKNGNLYVYKPFTYYSIFGDENYFNEKHFVFKITDY